MDAGTRRRRAMQASVVAVLAVFLAACAGSTGTLSNVGDAVGQSGAGALAPGAPAAATSGTDASRNAQGAKTGGAVTVPADDALIVKTGTLSLQVADLDAALAKANTAIRALGGYVSGSQRSNDGDRATAQVIYRIPAARWDDALAALHGVAQKVLGEQTNAVEVTGQVLDLGARIDNLQATEKALQAIMARATKIQDVLDVQQQLTDVRGQIEQLQTEKQHLEEQAALSTLTVDFGLPIVAVTAATKSWDPGAELDRALAQLVEVGQALATAGLWFVIVWLPVLLLLGVVGLVGLFVVRRARVLRRVGRAEPPLPAAPEA